ncbi:MAG: hypothetical protein JSS82_04175 [Bacteroidetes bacterium]|nr:hypothetical protein [Bacteroidota bacterium]
MATKFQNVFGPFVSPLIFLGCSISLALLYMRVSGYADLYTYGNSAIKVPTVVSVLLFAASGCIILFSLRKIFVHDMPLKDAAAVSDVIPQIIELTRRFVHGGMPYAPIEFSGYTLYPTYLPLQWLPYTIAELAKIDYRWVPVVFLWLSCTHHFLTAKPYRQRSIYNVLAALWPLLLWGLLIKNDSDNFGITVESLVASYYLFTANAIKRGKIMPITIGLCLTLLSRYAIIFWVPCLLAVVSWNKGSVVAVKMVAAVLVAFVLIYWLPFMRHDSRIFLKGYAYHSAAALGEWGHIDRHGRPMHLYNGLGMAAFAHQFFPLSDLQQRLHYYQLLHIFLCVATVIGLTWWYRNNKLNISSERFLLFSLKIYITVFYVFIQIPYKYLFITPLLLTSVLLADAFGPTREISVSERSGFVG